MPNICAAIALNTAPPLSMESGALPSPLRDMTANLARGTDAAWADFHRNHGPWLFRYVLGGARGDYDLASDALQQTYLRIARYARPCDSAPQFESWLRLIARSALNDCRRRRKSFWQRFSHPWNDEDTGSDQIEETGNETVFAALDTALALLDPAERKLLEEKYFSGAEVRELAEKYQITPKAVESRLTRAREKLRRHLSKTLSHHE